MKPSTYAAMSRVSSRASGVRSMAKARPAAPSTARGSKNVALARRRPATPRSYRLPPAICESKTPFNAAAKLGACPTSLTTFSASGIQSRLRQTSHPYTAPGRSADGKPRMAWRTATATPTCVSCLSAGLCV